MASTVSNSNFWIHTFQKQVSFTRFLISISFYEADLKLDLHLPDKDDKISRLINIFSQGVMTSRQNTKNVCISIILEQNC